MKTTQEIAQEYINEYPKVERNEEECLFENYIGNNGNKIKAKKRKYLEYYTDTVNFGSLFIDSKEKEFWDKLISSNNITTYIWGSSILFDFGDNFYYQLCNFDEDIGNTYNYIMTNKSAYIIRYNSDLKDVEEIYKSDIIIL